MRILPSYPLWFASILLFLHYESQLLLLSQLPLTRCDLLRFYYFCIMNPNLRWLGTRCWSVVICFDFIIFALWIPTLAFSIVFLLSLWFASILLFLHYESQRPGVYQRAITVVICFDFIIFALWIPTLAISHITSTTLWFASILLFLHYESQPAPEVTSTPNRCDLLRFYYFCIMNPNVAPYIIYLRCVVICFDFIIFALWIPTLDMCCLAHCSCDLLRFYYFCIMNPNCYSDEFYIPTVVICFDFIIFALWIPT